MKEHADFITTFSVDESPEAVFNAICDVRGWWSENIEGKTDATGAEFTYSYKDVHRCVVRVTQTIPSKRVEWLVLANDFNFTKDKTEWKGTRIVFEIVRSREKTKVVFTHIGLTAWYECFEVCRDSWTFYIGESLRGLIMTGKGQPNEKETTVRETGG